MYLPCLPSRRPLAALAALGALLFALLALLLVTAVAPGDTARADSHTHAVHPAVNAVHLHPAVTEPPSYRIGATPTASTTQPTDPSDTRTPEDSGLESHSGSRSLPDTGVSTETIVAGIVAALLIIAGGLAARALRRRRG